MITLLATLCVQQAGIDWKTDHDAALRKAKEQDKLALVYFGADW